MPYEASDSAPNSAQTDDAKRELERLNSALQFVRGRPARRSVALVPTEMQSMMQRSDQSLSLMAESLRAFTRASQKSFEQRAAEQQARSNSSISHRLRAPKVTLGAMTAALGAVFVFPDYVTTSAILSTIIPVDSLTRFWPASVLALCCLWLLIWFHEGGLKGTAERALAFDTQNRALDLLLRRAEEFSRRRYRASLRHLVTGHYPPHSLDDDEADRQPPLSLIYMRIIRRAVTWPVGREIDRSTLDAAVDLALQRFEAKRWIAPTAHLRGELDDWYGIGEALKQ